MSEKKLDRLRAKRNRLNIKINEAALKAYGGTQTCTWCRQLVQGEDGWSITTYEPNPMFDVVKCGNCGGTAIYIWGLGMHYVAPLDPPKPRPATHIAGALSHPSR